MLLLVLTLVFYMATGEALPLQIMALLSVVALFFGSRLDKQKSGYFYVDGQELVIKNSLSSRRVMLSQIKDASIVDPGAAKRYIRQRIEEADNILSSKKRMHLFTQFCTIDIGLGAAPSWIIQFFQGHLSAKRNEVVLLRLRDDTDLLISPAHEQDAVSYLNKAILANHTDHAEEKRQAI
jgi:hypothetical protein